MRSWSLLFGVAACFSKPSPQTRDAGRDDAGIHDAATDSDDPGASCFTVASDTGILAMDWIDPVISLDGLALAYHVPSGSRLSIRTSLTQMFGTAIAQEGVALDESVAWMDEQQLHEALVVKGTTASTKVMADYELSGGPTAVASGVKDATANADLTFFVGVNPTNSNELVGTTGTATGSVIYMSGMTVASPVIAGQRIAWSEAGPTKTRIHLGTLNGMSPIADRSVLPFSTGATDDKFPMLTGDGQQLFFVRDGELYLSTCF